MELHILFPHVLETQPLHGVDFAASGAMRHLTTPIVTHTIPRTQGTMIRDFNARLGNGSCMEACAIVRGLRRSSDEVSSLAGHHVRTKYSWSDGELINRCRTQSHLQIGVLERNRGLSVKNADSSLCLCGTAYCFQHVPSDVRLVGYSNVERIE